MENKPQEVRQDQPEARAPVVMADRAAFGGHHLSSSGLLGNEGTWVELGTCQGSLRNKPRDWTKEPMLWPPTGESSGWKRGEILAEAPPSAATHSLKAELTSAWRALVLGLREVGTRCGSWGREARAAYWASRRSSPHWGEDWGVGSSLWN